MFGRRNVATLVAEFLGTGILTLLILSVQRSSIGQIEFFTAAAAGITYALLTLALARTSGALLNPGLTIGMWTARKISTLNTVLFIAAQLLGGFAALHLFTYYVKQPLQPIGGHFSGRILIAEAVGAGIFSFGVAAAMYQRLLTGTAAALAGLSLMVGMISASSAAIGLLNPAVALGDKAFVWGTYVLGPILGGIIGVNLYGLLFAEQEGVATATANNSASVAEPVTIAPAKAKPVAAKRKSTKRAAATKANKTTARAPRKKSAAKKK